MNAAYMERAENPQQHAPQLFVAARDMLTTVTRRCFVCAGGR